CRRRAGRPLRDGRRPPLLPSRLSRPRPAKRSSTVEVGPLPDARARTRCPDARARTRRPDAPRTYWGFHGAGTHWIRGFMAFQLARRIRDREADGADVTCVRLSERPRIARRNRPVTGADEIVRPGPTA